MLAGASFQPRATKTREPSLSPSSPTPPQLPLLSDVTIISTEWYAFSFFYQLECWTCLDKHEDLQLTILEH
jgi:hypothetical protein